jgi:hypothetical protein
MSFGDPAMADVTGDRLARDGADEHGKFVHGSSRRTDKVGVAGVVGEELAEYEAAGL